MKICIYPYKYRFVDVEKIQRKKKRKKMIQRYSDAGKRYLSEIKENEEQVEKIREEIIVCFTNC